MIKRSMILMVAISILLLACGAEDDQWSSWEGYNSPGVIVEGQHWTHEPTYMADTRREYRYDISTNRDVSAFVAPVDECSRNDALETMEVEANEVVVGDHGEAVCVTFNADLLSPDGSWHVEVFVRESI